jgi:hypothetical protein
VNVPAEMVLCFLVLQSVHGTNYMLGVLYEVTGTIARYILGLGISLNSNYYAIDGEY